ARHGVAACAVVAGVSGGGKSRLLAEFAARVSERGVWVLRGGGVEGAAQHPLQVLVGVVEGIVAEASLDPDLRDRLIAELAAAAPTLRDVLPGLSEVLPAVDGGPHFGEHARARAVSAITTLLTTLGSVDRPVVVMLDDCQWADELTVEVLTSFARDAQHGALPAHLALVVALRPEDVTADHPLLTSPGLPVVDLPPLDAVEVAEVVRSMAGDVPPELPALVDELSRGEPLMIGAVLRGLVESGALAPTPEGWELTAPSDGFQASQESAAILGRRISLLDGVTRRVLQAGAVYGRSFTLTAVAPLTGLSLGQAERAVRQAEERGLVWDAGDRFTIVHDRLRSSLLADIEPGNLSTLHRRIAEQIEAVEPNRAFELAHHFDAGGHAERALPYALRSAAIARSQHDLELAERNYRIAERGMASGSSAASFEVSEMLGEILMLRGRYDESADRFERARALAANDIAVARMEGRLGELVFRRDDLEGAAAHLETGLAILGERIPRRSVTVVLSLTWELLRRMLRGLPGRRTGGPAPTEKDLLRAHLYTQLQYPRWFKSQRMETMWLMVRQVNVAERCPNTRQLAHAYGVWGGALALTVPFLWKRGLRYTEISESISKAHHDVRGQGHAKSMRTCVLHAAGRYGEAEIVAAEAIKLLGEYGDRWETSFAARNRSMCLYRIGRMQEALEEASRVHRIGVDLGDANAEVTALEVLAKATDGRVRTAQTQRALRRQGADIEVRIASLQADALRLRHDGDLSGAISRLEHASGIVRRARPTNSYLVPALAWLATVRREAAERELLPAARRRALWKARRDARRAVRYARMFRNDRPHALRERGLVSALLGNSWRARRLLQRSIDVATDRAAWGELAQTRAEAERLGLELLIPIEAERATPWDSGRAERADLGLADRFEALLESGVRLAAADSDREIVAAVREVAVSLLRADSCRVVGLTSAWNRSQVDPSLAAAVDTLAALGRPIVVAPAAELTPPELAALVPAGARSAL
uniref:ATP-binding protein n=1 Tax=Sporichthya sp. TaxID=65475 RepID=UPI00182FFA43